MRNSSPSQRVEGREVHLKILINYYTDYRALHPLYILNRLLRDFFRNNVNKVLAERIYIQPRNSVQRDEGLKKGYEK